MQKIPTLFERDWEGDRSRVIDKVNPAAQWVADGEGVATRKYDGTACLIRDGVLYKRHALTVPEGSHIATLTIKPVTDVQRVIVAPERVPGVSPPPGFDPITVETSPGRKGPVTKAIGWLPVGDGPQDQWHREALDWLYNMEGELTDGTYELLGPKIQGNPERADSHILFAHSAALQIPDAPRDFAGLAVWLARADDIEGLVWHHPDGRMAKIKRRDFGFGR